MKEEQELNDVLADIADMENTGENPFFGMSYLDGVKAALEWVLNEAEHPLEP
jgi:hypothetical protein